jgi:ribose-phosphate pyrophosphokinase
MKPLLLGMPGNEPMAAALGTILPVEACPATVRRFPDGESYVRIEGQVTGRDLILLCTLDRPDQKLAALILLAGAAREAGAASVGLVAPYLAYMRQDCRFHEGEATSARHVAGWISRQVDWLVTVDPHLHRIKQLSEVYSIPNRVAHAAAAVAQWIRANVPNPLLIGPDEESSQWVSDIANRVGAPFEVLSKLRRGDREVAVSVPHVGNQRDRTPILVDDIVSTARTMIEAVRHVHACGLGKPVCVAVHPIFAEDSLQQLEAASVAQVISTNTITHRTNGISVAGALAEAIQELCPGLKGMVR